jgi:hypothetical protein
LTGAEPASDSVPAALTDGGGLKLGKPVGGVDGPCCADCAEGWALKPPVDVVGTALWVGAWLDG